MLIFNCLTWFTFHSSLKKETKFSSLVVRKKELFVVPPSIHFNHHLFFGRMEKKEIDGWRIDFYWFLLIIFN